MTIIVINNKRLQCGKRTKGALGSQEGIIARGVPLWGHTQPWTGTVQASPLPQSASPIHLLRKRKLSVGKADYLAQSPKAK